MSTTPSSADERAPLPPSALPLRDLLAQSSNVMRWAAERAAFAGQAPRAAAEAHAFADALGDMADKIRDSASLGAAQVPAGWKLVPIDPKKTMIDAGVMHTMRADEDEPYRARGEAIAAYMAMLDAAPEAPAGAAQVPSLSDADMQSLRRFQETTEDDQSYDIGKKAVQSLANAGALRYAGGSRYQVTDYGMWLLSQPSQPAADPWHDAVLNQCMLVESCYQAASPTATVAALIDWYVMHERVSRTPAPAAPSEDTQRLDHLANKGATVEVLPGPQGFDSLRFRIGGLTPTIRSDLREAIDAAIASSTKALG